MTVTKYAVWQVVVVRGACMPCLARIWLMERAVQYCLMVLVAAQAQLACCWWGGVSADCVWEVTNYLTKTVRPSS